LLLVAGTSVAHLLIVGDSGVDVIVGTLVGTGAGEAVGVRVDAAAVGSTTIGVNSVDNTGGVSALVGAPSGGEHPTSTSSDPIRIRANLCLLIIDILYDYSISHNSLGFRSPVKPIARNCG